MNLKGVLKGVGTTTFIATRVVGIVGAGLFALALASSIKDRLNGREEVEIAFTNEESE